MILKPPSIISQPPPSYRGVSLLEILVSLLILSTGLLGLASLQAKAMRYSQSALFRSQATILADDILERMRADRRNAIAGNWNTNYSDNAAYHYGNGTEIYNKELFDWKTQLEFLLPSGRATIQVDQTGKKGMTTVTLQWNDSRAGGEEAQTFATQTQF